MYTASKCGVRSRDNDSARTEARTYATFHILDARADFIAIIHTLLKKRQLPSSEVCVWTMLLSLGSFWGGLGRRRESDCTLSLSWLWRRAILLQAIKWELNDRNHGHVSVTATAAAAAVGYNCLQRTRTISQYRSTMWLRGIHRSHYATSTFWICLSLSLKTNLSPNTDMTPEFWSRLEVRISLRFVWTERKSDVVFRSVKLKL